jgi:hypothetical protein
MPLSVRDAMMSTAGSLAIAFATLAFAPPEQAGRGQPPRAGLPIRYSGQEGIIEVPLDTGLLGYRPRPSRAIIAEPIEPPRRGEEPEGEVTPQPERRARPMNLDEKAIKRECFDLWVFGELTEDERKLWLLSTLSEKVVVARGRGISAAEEEKLVLAGRGDIKRFFDRIDAIRAAFEGVRRDYVAGKDFLRGMSIHALSVEFEHGPFGESSLFSKTLRKIERERAT